MMGDYYGNMLGWGWGGGLLMALSWVALILFVVWIARAVSARDGPDERHRPKSAIDILTERYAKGEIDTKEFEERKRGMRDS